MKQQIFKSFLIFSLVFIFSIPVHAGDKEHMSDNPLSNYNQGKIDKATNLRTLTENSVPSYSQYQIDFDAGLVNYQKVLSIPAHDYFVTRKNRRGRGASDSNLNVETNFIHVSGDGNEAEVAYSLNLPAGSNIVQIKVFYKSTDNEDNEIIARLYKKNLDSNNSTYVGAGVYTGTTNNQRNSFSVMTGNHVLEEEKSYSLVLGLNPEGLGSNMNGEIYVYGVAVYYND